MAVKRSTNGKKWRADYYVWAKHPVTGAPYRKREAKDFRTKKEAELWAVSHQSKPLDRRYEKDLSAVRFIRDAVDFYLNSSKVLATTADNQAKYRFRLGQFLAWCDLHGLVLLSDITNDAAELYAGHVMKTFRRKGIESRLRLAGAIFRAELRRDNPTVSRNPFESVKRTGYAPISAVQYLPEATMLTLRRFATTEELAAIELLYNTGIRSSEAGRMEWSHVGVDRLLIPISKSQRARTVPLNSRAKAALEFYRERTAAQRYVILGDTPAERRWFTAFFEKFRRRMRREHPEIDVSAVSPHALRRSFATHTLQRGARIEDVSAVLGHSNVRVTQQYYATVSLDNKRSVTDLLL